MKKWILIFAGLAICAGVVLLLTQTKNTNSGAPDIISKILPIATPTSMPFAELTIPYLRARDYNSSLGELRKTSENSSYISYLTSFTSDGFKINGLLTIPNANPEPVEGWPAVVFVHGYIPPAQYRTNQNYASYVDFLARQGLVVFKIDLRGHDQSEGEASGGYYSSDYIIDTLNARAALQASDFVNPNGVGLWGHSMAGNVIFRALAAQTDIPAIVIWAGAVYSYSDFAKYSIDDNSYRAPPANSESVRKRRALFDTYGQFDPESEFWKQVAPTNYLQDIAGAIQIHHAVDDPVVNIGFSRDLMALLDKTYVVHELREHSSGGHNLIGGAFNTAMRETANFFTKHLN